MIGPVMVGPSSSHTAGAVKIGRIARSILAQSVRRAEIYLYNSFAKTGKGHGTDIALIGGLLGLEPDEERIKDAYAEAEKQDMHLKIHWEMEPKRDYEPNTAVLRLYGATGQTSVTGVSVGGGEVRITEIDGYSVELDCGHDTLITRHRDVVGVVSEVTAIIARHGVNLAYLRLHRQKRGEAMMVLETDDPIAAVLVDEVKRCGDILWACYVPKL